MPDGGDAIQVRVLDRISDVPAAEWDACAGPDDPFVSHAFLHALEASGSVASSTGWMPRHLAITGPDGTLAAAMPLYAKSHSYGEYMFDWGWADAYERAGGRYYPKLESQVPFTPVTGPRLLVRPQPDGADGEARLRGALIGAAEGLAEQYGIATVHVIFPNREDWEALGEAGWLRRTGVQFHWRNRGYATFDDFLADLASRKRKAIKKERRVASEAGIRLHRLTGDAIRPEHWDAFFNFYRNTSDRKWGSAYLTRDFFHRLGELMPDRVMLVMGEPQGAPGHWVCGALNLIGGDTLYGRNWGCSRHVDFLHFEACYYQAIEFAIERGLKAVEAGAQGEHKIQRGYLPAATYGAYLIRDKGLEDAIQDFLQRERIQNEGERRYLAEHSPYRKDLALEFDKELGEDPALTGVPMRFR
ncbi:MAG: GNAT family N-acetyltransferase [Alphaproteobacteria bacterium]|nr:GNAT family N-acetyltransferase [Alphaproteobacteria bacterium]